METADCNKRLDGISIIITRRVGKLSLHMLSLNLDKFYLFVTYFWGFYVRKSFC